MHVEQTKTVQVSTLRYGLPPTAIVSCPKAKSSFDVTGKCGGLQENTGDTLEDSVTNPSLNTNHFLALLLKLSKTDCYPRGLSLMSWVPCVSCSDFL